MIKRVTHYGKPSDPFVRMTDEYELRGDTLHVNRTVIGKPTRQIEITVQFVASSRWRMWMSAHAPTLLAVYDRIRIWRELRRRLK